MLLVCSSVFDTSDHRHLSRDLDRSSIDFLPIAGKLMETKDSLLHTHPHTHKCRIHLRLYPYTCLYEAHMRTYIHVLILTPGHSIRLHTAHYL